jgi:hypothetical protein
MKIIVDECLPKRITLLFPNEDAYTVAQIGLSGATDKMLLTELDNKKIDVFITIDGNIEYQQQFKDRVFGTIVIRSVSNRYADLLHLKDKLVWASSQVNPGEIIHIP